MKKRRHYSGDSSHWFWDRVNQVTPHRTWSKLYSLGCKLQTLEHKVMEALEAAEQRPPRKKGRRPNSEKE